MKISKVRKRVRMRARRVSSLDFVGRLTELSEDEKLMLKGGGLE